MHLQKLREINLSASTRTYCTLFSRKIPTYSSMLKDVPQSDFQMGKILKEIFTSPCQLHQNCNYALFCCKKGSYTKENH